MIDWDFWRWVATTVVAVGALALSVWNTSRTWRYTAHWTVEVLESGGVRVFNRTKEDAVDAFVYASRPTGPNSSHQLESYAERLVEPDGVIEVPTEQWLGAGIDWYVTWRRSTTQRWYLQRFGEPESRRLRTRLRLAREAFRKDSVRGRRQPMPRL